MATALQIITRAMRLVGAIGQGETPTAQEAQDGLSALNAMLDSWATERLKVFHVERIGPFNLAAGTASYTIGSGGTFNVTRPLRIEGGYVRDNGQDYGFRVTTERAEYDRIADKGSATQYPTLCFHEPAYPLGTLWFWPTPSRIVPVYLMAWNDLQSFTLLTAELSLPNGYQRAIEHNLAAEIAPEFGKEVPPSVMQIARKSLRGIRQLNADPGVLQMEGSARFNVYSDSYL